jgi:hypothetical protein
MKPAMRAAAALLALAGPANAAKTPPPPWYAFSPVTLLLDANAHCLSVSDSTPDSWIADQRSFGWAYHEDRINDEHGNLALRILKREARSRYSGSTMLETWFFRDRAECERAVSEHKSGDIIPLR